MRRQEGGKREEEMKNERTAAAILMRDVFAAASIVFFPSDFKGFTVPVRSVRHRARMSELKSYRAGRKAGDDCNGKK